MIPHSYAIDSQNRAQDLASAVLAASSPSQISAACSAVEAFLHKHPSDQSRSFFSIAFPALICKLFGFDGSSPSPSRSSLPSSGWIDQADPGVARRVFELLSPRGILLSTISAVDRHSLVKYVFPIERLPEWMRYVLQSERNCSMLPDLCPLFTSRVTEDSHQGSFQIQLNVFEYYMFWFAYYPVSKGKSENLDTVVVRKSRRFKLENWTSSWPVLSSRGCQSGQKSECSIYTRLLYSYLCTFVPKCNLGSYQPYRSSLLHYSSSYDGSIALQAKFLVYTFIHFWMVDNDFSPLPMGVCSSFGVSFPFRVVLGETPPTAGLGEVLKLLVKYLNCSLIAPMEESYQVECGGVPGWNAPGSHDGTKSRSTIVTCENFVGSWNSQIQRPLYRFILRTFLFCPMGTTIKNAAQVFSLWMSFIEPWKTTPEDFLEFEVMGGQNRESLGKENSQFGNSREGKDSYQSELEYSPVWQGYAISNYLFYSSLVVHFLGFAHKFLHTNAYTIIQMVLKLLTIMTSSKAMIDLLKKVDAAYHSKPAMSSSSTYDSFHKFVPTIREQLQDWENGLCESDADGSFLHENWNRDLRLFNDGEDGAHQLLQLLILRAEAEIQSMSGDNMTQSLQTLNSLRTQMDCLFGGPVLKPTSQAILAEACDHQHGRDEVFTPKHPGVGKRRWADVKYKGDWMRRPISESEVSWLARLLVRLSDWLNEILGLDRGQGNDSLGPTYVKVSSNDLFTICGPKEAMRMLLGFVVSWLGLVGHVVVRFMRERGMRINLRGLASKKFVMLLLLVSFLVCALRNGFWTAFTISR